MLSQHLSWQQLEEINEYYVLQCELHTNNPPHPRIDSREQQKKHVGVRTTTSPMLFITIIPILLTEPVIAKKCIIEQARFGDSVTERLRAKQHYTQNHSSHV